MHCFPHFAQDTVDAINPATTLRTLNYGNSSIFLIMGNAGFIPSAVVFGSFGWWMVVEEYGEP